ncbi:hypothetical protein LT493_00300 [Streptomyces tricolor]|nr:hypothetical protein [Streptomyces tricolor]
MPETSDPVAARWPLASPRTADWLRELAGDGVTGFMPPPLPDAAWVLNAMYEHERGPDGVAYDAYHRARVADGSVARHIVGGPRPHRGGGSPPAAGSAAPGIRAPAGGGCAGRNWPRGPATPWCPRDSCPPSAASPRRSRAAAGRCGSRRPPRAAWTASPGTG